MWEGGAGRTVPWCVRVGLGGLSLSVGGWGWEDCPLVWEGLGGPSLGVGGPCLGGWAWKSCVGMLLLCALVWAGRVVTVYCSFTLMVILIAFFPISQCGVNIV